MTDSIEDIINQIYRNDYSKLVSVLTHAFGIRNFDLAEDVVQESILEAMKIWNKKGIPQNSKAWIYKVAKNKAVNVVNKEVTHRKYETDIAQHLKFQWSANIALERMFT
jgi:RNA polymerase sigma-70 factor (ECF subfamily)